MATSTRPGDLLAERYRLIDLLSESGGGRFWRAHDRVLERYVALHVISADDPRADELLTAARESARVHDPRVLRVLDATTTAGLCYVVNEWGTGTSLDILITHGGPLGPRRSTYLVAEVAGAIQTAHDAGVAHGRLNPENVLIDRFGAIKLIGLGVDAALHGLPRGRRSEDRAGIGGLLYCALTGTWPGPSSSAVEPAPRDHETVLAPRRVRAGVPRQLDELWLQITDRHPRRIWPGAHEEVDVSSAGAIGDRLMEFLGDPTGLPQALAASIPPINEVRPVDLPAVPDPVVRDEPTHPPPAEPPPPPEPDPDTEATQVVEADEASTAADAPVVADDPDQTTQAVDHEVTQVVEADEQTQAIDAGSGEGAPDRPSVSSTDLPTEAGTPIFDDEEVEWFQASRTPPPPPPPFEEPPERPLFAPDPPDGEPVRRPRADVRHPPPASFDSSPDSPAPPPPSSLWDSSLSDTADQPVVPGRSSLRVALLLGAAVLLLVAVVVAFNLGRGRTPLGAEREEEPTASPTPTQPAQPINGLQARDLDPFGDPPEENPASAPLAVDGNPATTWNTSSYIDNFDSDRALKPGVGLVIDLGEPYQVTEVELSLVGAPTNVELYLGNEDPAGAPSGNPMAAGTAEGPQLKLSPEGDAQGQYLTVWFTSLPSVSGGYRAEVAEVVVRGR